MYLCVSKNDKAMRNTINTTKVAGCIITVSEMKGSFDYVISHNGNNVVFNDRPFVTAISAMRFALRDLKQYLN